MARDMVERPLEATAINHSRPVVVSVPTQTKQVYEQVVLGRQSPYATDVEEFRGIPYGKTDGRWKHSVVRTRLPCDVFDATRNGYLALPSFRYGFMLTAQYQSTMSTAFSTEHHRSFSIPFGLSSRRRRV